MMNRRMRIQTKFALFSVFFVVVLVLASTFYWQKIIQPTLVEDVQSLTSSVASARVNELVPVFDSDSVTEDQLVDAMDGLLVYTSERNQRQFFNGIGAELSFDYYEDNNLPSHIEISGLECRSCYIKEYPIYSKTGFKLLAVVSVEISNAPTDSYIQSVQRMFLTGFVVVFVSLLVVLAVIWGAVSLLGTWNENLEAEVDNRTESLEREVKAHLDTQLKLGEVKQDIQDMERERIAKTLHDGVGQVLQAIKLGLQRLGAQEEGRNKGLVNELVQETGLAITTVRNFTSELTPLSLDNASLGTALTGHVERLDGRMENVSLSFQESGDADEDMSKLVREQLFLATTELINNALKHSQADLILIYLENTASRIYIEVRDNGVGFDKEDIIGTAKGLGLMLIQERCSRINGHVVFDSTVGQGTTARLSVDR